MKRTIPDGDPLLNLTDDEHHTLVEFSHAWAGRYLAALDMDLAAALICFLRKPEPYLRNYTGAVIHWNRDGENHYAECHLHDGIWCHTNLGMVRADMVAEYENDSRFRGHRKIDHHLTGVR